MSAVTALWPAAASTGGFAEVGDASARLLAGPPAVAGAEPLRAHVRRLGPLVDALGEPAALRAEARDAGLTGRGGGAFPLAGKLDLAARTGRNPLVVVNASEGEPASRKDEALVCLRPHLVLDGAVAAAAAVGAREAIIYVHHHRHSLRILDQALAERSSRQNADVQLRVVIAPGTYLAGESGAVVNFLERAEAIPRARTQPVAASGVGGRPSVVANAETVAHFALIARFGAGWYREAGSPDAPGSTLLTLAGDVARPGLVVELLGPTPVSALLGQAGALGDPPRAILFGGYAGTWVDGRRAWSASVDRHALAAAGIGLGCGLLGVLGRERCGLMEAARLSRWLSDESAGQCGPCAYGMPALAATVEELAFRRSSHRLVGRIHELGASIVGRGLCHLPDGAAAMVDSALETFGEEVRAHGLLRRCPRDHRPAASTFPLPPRLAQ